MANVTSPDIVHKVRHMAEFGNCISEDFPALALTGVAATEKAYVGVIPAGTRVQKLRVVTSALLSATSTIDVGFEPLSGTDPTADNDYWFNDLAADAAINAVSAAEPITFNKAVKIVVLVNTADVENSPTVTVYYAGQALGAP
jgi:hypothetical protein